MTLRLVIVGIVATAASLALVGARRAYHLVDLATAAEHRTGVAILYVTAALLASLCVMLAARVRLAWPYIALGAILPVLVIGHFMGESFVPLVVAVLVVMGSRASRRFVDVPALIAVNVIIVAATAAVISWPERLYGPLLIAGAMLLLVGGIAAYASARRAPLPARPAWTFGVLTVSLLALLGATYVHLFVE